MKLLKLLPLLLMFIFFSSNAHAAKNCDEIKGNIVGKMCEYLGICGNIWEYVGICGNTWEYVGICRGTGVGSGKVHIYTIRDR